MELQPSRPTEYFVDFIALQMPNKMPLHITARLEQLKNKDGNYTIND